MSARLRTAKRWSIALLAVAALVSIPVYGWAMQAPFLVAGVVVAVGELVMVRVRRPERSSAAVFVVAQCLIVVAIALAAGPRVYALSIFAFPVLVAAPQLPRRVVAVGTGLTVVVMVGTALALMPGAVAATPPALILPATMLIVVAVLAAMTLDAEQSSRHAAVVDPLTGLLNRTALQARAAELTHRLFDIGSAGGAVIVGDVDRLKAINDEHGHTTGDEVLVSVARRLESVVGRHGALYRFGGEEFVVVLDDAAAGDATRLAERMRDAAHHETAGGLVVTMSFGVATSDPHVRDFALLFACADRALYRAKAAGRDRVVVSRPHDLAGASLAAAKQTGVSLDRRVPVEPRAVAPAPVTNPSDRSSDTPQSLLIRTATERQHMLDIFARQQRVSMITNPISFVALLSTIPWFGWKALIPVVASIAVAHAIHLLVPPRVARPEYPMTFAVVVVLVGVGLAFLTAHPAPLFALPFLIVILFVTAAALPARGAAALTVIGAGVMAAVALLMDAHAVVSNPSTLALPLALLGAVALVGHGIGRATIDQLGVATIDPLTGMLNRAALPARVAELTHRLSASGEPAAVLIADLDTFKEINDEHGHASGDRVLAGVAERLRESLRLDDSAYRIGGEEFLVLLGGLDERSAADIAERIRASVGERSVAGLRVTVSIGVSACAAGQAFDYDALFNAADAALLAAKANGRDLVVAASALATATATAA